MNNNLLTYLRTYLRSNNNKKKQEGHTTQIIYNKDDWMKFKHILDYESTNPSRLFWSVVEIVLEQFDQKEHSLDKYLSEYEVVTPNVDTEPEKVLKFLQTLPIEKVKEYEEKFTRNLIYAKAITQGEIELENYPYLWKKYH